LADFAELKENDFNLNIPRYVNTFEPEPRVNMAVVNVEINSIKTELVDIEEKMAGYLRELGLDE
jgi:type I restriction enzyme M protein